MWYQSWCFWFLNQNSILESSAGLEHRRGKQPLRASYFKRNFIAKRMFSPIFDLNSIENFSRLSTFQYLLPHPRIAMCILFHRPDNPFLIRHFLIQLTRREWEDMILQINLRQLTKFTSFKGLTLEPPSCFVLHISFQAILFPPIKICTRPKKCRTYSFNLFDAATWEPKGSHPKIGQTHYHRVY